MFSLRDGRNNFADQAEQRHRRNDHVPTGLVVFDLEYLLLVVTAWHFIPGSKGTRAFLSGKRK